jgi:carboxylesterase type B
LLQLAAPVSACGTGIVSSQAGPVCPQCAHHQNARTVAKKDGHPQSEDCLSINVWQEFSAGDRQISGKA